MTNNLELLITIKNVYGKETVYPICDISKGLTAFKGQKTLTENDILSLKKLGYSFKVASSYQHIMGALSISETAY